MEEGCRGRTLQDERRPKRADIRTRPRRVNKCKRRGVSRVLIYNHAFHLNKFRFMGRQRNRGQVCSDFRFGAS